MTVLLMALPIALSTTLEWPFSVSRLRQRAAAAQVVECMFACFLFKLMQRHASAPSRRQAAAEGGQVVAERAGQLGSRSTRPSGCSIGAACTLLHTWAWAAQHTPPVAHFFFLER